VHVALPAVWIAKALEEIGSLGEPKLDPVLLKAVEVFNRLFV
jgi:hypothetical protein